MHQHALTPGTGPAAQRAGQGAAKVLLDGEAIERTLSRIAHEIIERNERPRATSRSSASTPAASRSPSACGA